MTYVVCYIWNQVWILPNNKSLHIKLREMMAGNLESSHSVSLNERHINCLLVLFYKHVLCGMKQKLMRRSRRTVKSLKEC